MKTRNGFVSNSSSSSFIVIGSNIPDHVKEREIAALKNEIHCGGVLHIKPKLGTYEFGWDEETYDDLFSKIIFCYLQARYFVGSDSEKPDSEKMEMLERVLKAKAEVDAVHWFFEEDEGYIDHQSAAHEGQNLEMFESDEILSNFIFGGGASYIQGGNDNGSYPYDDYPQD